MGAQSFLVHVRAATAKTAFNTAREAAQFEDGHGGYTGTIAEKTSFKMIVCPEGIHPEDYAEKLIEEEDARIDDKWGPAGCIDCSYGEFLFFGWASS